MSVLKGLAQAALMLALLPALVLLNLWSIARSGARRHSGPAGSSLTVLVPYAPGNKSGASKAMEGLLATLRSRFTVTVVPLYELKASGGLLRKRLSALLTWPLHMPLHCRDFLLAPRAVSDQLPDDAPVLLEFVSGSLFLLLGRRPRGLIVLRDHEVPCRRLLMEARARNRLARPLALLRVAAAYLMTFNIYLKVDRIVALTEEDGDFIRHAFPWFAKKTTVIPAAIDLPDDVPTSRVSTDEILLLANFYHRPNVDGLLWFMRECAPHFQRPVTLHLVGLNHPLDSLHLDAAGVTVVRHGFVEDVAGRFAHVPIAVAPIISGGGLRIKNLYLASLGKAIITTPLANQGIHFVQDVEAVICDTGLAMARAIERLFSTPEEAVQLGRRAREAVRVRFGPEATLEQYCTEVFERPARTMSTVQPA